MHTNGYDEALGLPTEESATLALRTQQIIANETGVTKHVDPLGAPFAEDITRSTIEEAKIVVNQIDSLGGAIEGVKLGTQAKMIHESAWKQQKQLENLESRVVGVNVFVEEEASYPAGQAIASDAQESQIKKIMELKSSRSEDKVRTSLSQLETPVETGDNLIEYIRNACKNHATVVRFVQSYGTKWGHGWLQEGLNGIWIDHIGIACVSNETSKNSGTNWFHRNWCRPNVDQGVNISFMRGDVAPQPKIN